MCVCVCVCVCIYKILTFSVNTWSESGVEVIKHNNKKWINEKNLEKVLGYKNLVKKRNIILTNIKKEDMKYKIVKIFNLIENLLKKN